MSKKTPKKSRKSQAKTTKSWKNHGFFSKKFWSEVSSIKFWYFLGKIVGFSHFFRENKGYLLNFWEIAQNHGLLGLS